MAVLALVWIPGRAACQDTVLIRDTPRCVQCGVTLTKLVTLTSGAVSFRVNTRVVVSGEHYVAAPTYTPGELAVFNKAGEYLRSMGRPGSGPGEFSSALQRLAAGPADSLHVVEHNRWLIFEPGTFRFVRMVTLPAAPTSFAIDGRGNMLAAFPWRTDSGAQFSVSVIGRDSGTVIRSFEPAAREDANDPFLFGALRVLEATGSDLWSTPLNRITIKRHGIDNPDAQIFIRRDGWFAPWSGYSSAEPLRARPRPQVAGVQPSRSSIIVYATVADRNWKEYPLPPLLPGQERPRVAFDPNTVFDGVVEIVDRSSGRVLAHQQFDLVPRPLRGTADLAQVTRETASGEYVIDIYRVRAR